MIVCTMLFSLYFFFNDTATTEIYTLSLHDALPIFPGLEGLSVALLVATIVVLPAGLASLPRWTGEHVLKGIGLDRKSTRLNSSHPSISYAVFCLKKKKKQNQTPHQYHNTLNTIYNN